MREPWNEDYPPGEKCEACSAHFPVPVYHPAGRPCDKATAEWVPADKLGALLGVGDTLVEPFVAFPDAADLQERAEREGWDD